MFLTFLGPGFVEFSLAASTVVIKGFEKSNLKFRDYLLLRLFDLRGYEYFTDSFHNYVLIDIEFLISILGRGENFIDKRDKNKHLEVRLKICYVNRSFSYFLSN